MLEAICSELAAELGEAFPDLTVKSIRGSSNYITVDFDGDGLNGVLIWLKNDMIMCSFWGKTSLNDALRSPYGDPEVFDRVQSYVSEQYEAYSLDKGQSRC